MGDIFKKLLDRAEVVLAEAYEEIECLKRSDKVWLEACQQKDAEIERLQSEIEQLLKAHAAYEQAITKIEDEWHHV